MSDASQVALIYDQETAFGVTDGGNPKYKSLRFTSESLRQDTTVVNSQEIRSDRQLTGIKRTDIRASGAINFELSYAAFDDFLEAALLSAAWTAAPADTGSISLDSVQSDNSFNRTTGDFTADGFAAGQWVKTTGFTSNNVFAKITSVTALKMVVSGVTLSDEGASAGRQILQGAQILQGTTFRSFTIEREYADLSNEFAVFNGMAIEALNLSTVIGQIVTGSFEFLGSKESSATATNGDGSPTAAATNDLLSSVDDVKQILENQAAQTGILNWTLSLRNNLRARSQIGTLGAISIGTGTIEVTGTFQQYFSTKTLYDKYLNQNFTSLAIRFADAAGNSYVLDLPQVRFSAGQRVAGGQNTDVIADLQYSAFLDPTETNTIRIARWAA